MAGLLMEGIIKWSRVLNYRDHCGFFWSKHVVPNVDYMGDDKSEITGGRECVTGIDHVDVIMVMYSIEHVEHVDDVALSRIQLVCVGVSIAEVGRG